MISLLLCHCRFSEAFGLKIGGVHMGWVSCEKRGDGRTVQARYSGTTNEASCVSCFVLII